MKKLIRIDAKDIALMADEFPKAQYIDSFYVEQLEAENERLRMAMRKARGYRTPMGGSMDQWFRAVTEILEDALQFGKENWK